MKLFAALLALTLSLAGCGPVDGELAVDNGGREGHELRDEQRQHQLGRIDAQGRTVAGCHGDDRVDTVNIKEVA